MLGTFARAGGGIGEGVVAKCCQPWQAVTGQGSAGKVLAGQGCALRRRRR